ncbi:MAG: sigma-70 family RNA polymerase sigma factor [Acidimicrobiales bacterium]
MRCIDLDELIDDTERCLVQRACDGDATAFGELVAHHSTSALRVATVVLGTAEGASDAVQSATLRAWRARGEIDPGRGFRAWYLRIVANTARNDRRSRSRRAALAVKATAIPAVEVITPEAAAVTATDREIVLRALNRLSAEDRLVLALRFFEEMTQADIAQVLDCPIGTAKSRLSRAMARLRKVLSSGSEGM